MSIHSLDELRVFVQVTESGGITAAARALKLPQTTVSRRLAALEERVGRRLIHRTTRSMRVSEAGLILLESARVILAEADAAMAALDTSADELAGPLSLGCPSILIDDALRAVGPLMEAHPQLRVELRINDRRVNPIAEGVDVAIWALPLPDSALIARRLTTIRLILAASEAYLARRGTPQTPQDLTAHDIVRMAGPRPFIMLTGPDGQRHKVQPLFRLETNDARAAQQAISAGLGIGLSSIRALHWRPNLRRVLPAYHVADIQMVAIYAPAKTRSARIQAVVDCLQRSLDEAVRPAPTA